MFLHGVPLTPPTAGTSSGQGASDAALHLRSGRRPGGTPGQQGRARAAGQRPARQRPAPKTSCGAEGNRQTWFLNDLYCGGQCRFENVDEALNLNDKGQTVKEEFGLKDTECKGTSYYELVKSLKIIDIRHTSHVLTINCNN